jgi:hypothetical protein
VGRGGIVLLQLGLSRAARGVLRNGGTVRTSIDVSYSRLSAVQHLRGTLKRPGGAAVSVSATGRSGR